MELFKKILIIIGCLALFLVLGYNLFLFSNIGIKFFNNLNKNEVSVVNESTQAKLVTSEKIIEDQSANTSFEVKKNDPKSWPVIQQLFNDSIWQLSLQYPDQWKLSKEKDAVHFKSPDGAQEYNLLWTSYQIPRPALDSSRIEQIKGQGWVGTLYHDKDMKTGEHDIDILIFQLPDKKYDIYFAGYGNEYNQMLKLLTLKK